MNFKNIGILGAILLLPVAIFLVLKSGQTIVTDLPYFGEPTVEGTDTQQYKAPLSGLFEDKWPDKHLILHFVPDSPTVLSEHAVGNLKNIQERLPEVDNIILLTVFSNGIEKHNIPFNDHWQKTQLKTPNNLKDGWLDVFPGYEKSKEYDQDQVLVLLDKDRQVRGFYQAANDRLPKDLLGELRVLILNE
ncbi:MAG: hypothetical protein KDC92_07340 [Bacteroidetes bacterium]|nr:hypothetical protein [Bacteroidota bacterium]